MLKPFSFNSQGGIFFYLLICPQVYDDGNNSNKTQ